MKNIRKADCCWNCYHSIILLDYDSPYDCRCTVNANNKPIPENPILEDSPYDLDDLKKFFDDDEAWKKERPEVPYGDICDLFERKYP